MKTNKFNVGEAASEFGPAVTKEFHKFVEDIEQLVTQTTSLTGDELARAKANLGARIASAKEAVGDMGHDVAKRARKGAKATDRYVHDQPWKVIGASAAIAFLVGFALARRD